MIGYVRSAAGDLNDEYMAALCRYMGKLLSSLIDRYPSEQDAATLNHDFNALG